MLIQYLVDPKDSLPKDLTSDEENSEVKKSILDAIVSQYIERGARLASNMNGIYGIIW